MKNVTSLKSINTNSPKTPGGISKALLTPCRRLGLSRNWKKSGPSPFISPLSCNSQVVTEDNKETRKRKQRIPDANIEATPNAIDDDENEEQTENTDKTPSRNIVLPRRKKSKTLIATINTSQEDIEPQLEGISDNCNNKDETVEESVSIDINNSVKTGEVSTPVRTKSKKSKKRNSPPKIEPKVIKPDVINKPDDSNKDDKPTECEESTPSIDQISKDQPVYAVKERSPNDLSKECVVVIQRKIFKNINNNKTTKTPNTELTQNNEKPTVSDAELQNKQKPIENDSESDEEPLINIHRQNSNKSKTTNVIDEDNDFIDSKIIKPKPKNVNTTKSPKNILKANKTNKMKPEKIIKEPKPSSQDCFDDEDDDFDNKKTILIRKTYDKVSKPIKAKSTGSVTQRDIEKLKDRIEAKKKLLLAQSLTPETEELRTLIKKWQKGCQDALMELLDLMRDKCPDKARMDHAEMLKALKIPPSLVGYDSENDCFNSPDDATIILGNLKDI